MARSSVMRTDTHNVCTVDFTRGSKPAIELAHAWPAQYRKASHNDAVTAKHANYKLSSHSLT